MNTLDTESDYHLWWFRKFIRTQRKSSQRRGCTRDRTCGARRRGRFVLTGLRTKQPSPCQRWGPDGVKPQQTDGFTVKTPVIHFHPWKFSSRPMMSEEPEPELKNTITDQNINVYRVKWTLNKLVLLYNYKCIIYWKEQGRSFIA